MIVTEPPYDLVVLFADTDAQAFFEELIERGQERHCLAKFRWRSLRDARRDAFISEPDAALSPFIAGGTKILLIWDHKGSGRETEPPGQVEDGVVAALVRRGVSADRVGAVALDPELESLPLVAWDRVKDVLAELRHQRAPSNDLVLERARRRDGAVPDDVIRGVAGFPKEMLQGIVDAVNLRFSATVHRQLGKTLSIPALKHHPTAARISQVLEHWFPG